MHNQVLEQMGRISANSQDTAKLLIAIAPQLGAKCEPSRVALSVTKLLVHLWVSALTTNKAYLHQRADHAGSLFFGQDLVRGHPWFVSWPAN
jgi:hypothetical protein